MFDLPEMRLVIGRMFMNRRLKGQLVLRLIAGGSLANAPPHSIDRTMTPWRSFAAVVAAGAIMIAITLAF